MVKPRALRPGDRVAVVSPASPFKRDEFDAGVAELRALGFEPVYDERVFAKRGYVAGDPEVRAAAIHDAWTNPSVAALVGVRGGYGSIQVLPLLDPDLARTARKPFIGYSDLTSLLVFLNGACGLVAFHGPMLARRLGRGEEGYHRQSLLACVTRAEPAGELCPSGLESLRPGEASGPLFGGTLSQLVGSLGTPYAFDPPDGFVLFLDEVGERPYRIDRMFTQLRLSGILGRARAIVWGELPWCDEPGGEYSARATAADLVRDFSGPVLAGFPSGHTTGPAWTLPFGVRASVVANARPALVIEEAAVA
ncbi:MAG: S66 peptidase family protein [Vicinamibacterales bacterium]